MLLRPGSRCTPRQRIAIRLLNPVLVETPSRSPLQAPRKHSNCRKGQNTTKRELIDSGTDKRYVRRDQDRRLKASVDARKSLAVLTKNPNPDVVCLQELIARGCLHLPDRNPVPGYLQLKWFKRPRRLRCDG